MPGHFIQIEAGSSRSDSVDVLLILQKGHQRFLVLCLMKRVCRKDQKLQETVRSLIGHDDPLILWRCFVQSDNIAHSFHHRFQCRSLQSLAVFHQTGIGHNAPFGQFLAHSIHNMHSVPFSRFLELSVTSTFIGQTCMHFPQEMHFSLSHFKRIREK